MTTSMSPRSGALSTAQMQQQLTTGPEHLLPAEAAASRYAGEAASLWGGRVAALMSSAQTQGRYHGAKLSCPPTACTGSIELAPGASSRAWRNPQAIENIVCTEGSIELRFGPKLESTTTLGLFDMASVPANVRHQWVNASGSKARIVSVLSIAPGESYDAVFSEDDAQRSPSAEEALGVRFDNDPGSSLTVDELAARTTRFATLVPYKKDLQRTNGLPPEATMRLSAGSVFPLIVPEGHVGRSRTAPMYGNQGLYLSIAECTAGTDGPPPHAHSDTQESFYVLRGSFNICTGLENESAIPAKEHDLFAVPTKVMRTFQNTFGSPSLLLVIIQGPDRMQDTVSFSETIGKDFVEQFGPDIIEKYAAVRMTFDAEARLAA